MKLKDLIYLMLGLIFLGIFYIFFLLFYPFKTLTVNSSHALNTPKAGEVLMYEVDYCKYTTAPATVFRTLHTVDETSIVPFPAVDTISITGCNKVSVPLQLYPSTPPGAYYLQVDVQFKINALREIHYQFRTNPFKIL